MPPWRAGPTAPLEIIWGSAAMGAVLHLVGKVASRPVTALLMGETGTGKSMLAHAIQQPAARAALHRAELRRVARGPFGYRRGAFSGAVQDRQGLLEAVDGGTIFLDEVSELRSGCGHSAPIRAARRNALASPARRAQRTV